MKLNLGCGSVTPDGWINVDYAFGAWLVKVPFFSAINRRLRIINLDWNRGVFVHNLTKTFPWGDMTADIIYSSHTLEHLSKAEGRFFLGECARVLKKGGIIRLIVPDLEYVVGRYNTGEIRADEFLDQLGVDSADRPVTLKGKLKMLLQSPHKCMYDKRTLIQVLKESGLDASEKEPYQSDIAGIGSIEKEGRVQNAVIVEALKR